MARLPTIGADDNTWGTVLNDYLSVSLDAGGAIKSTAIKTVNSTSLIGSGDVAVQASLVSGTNIKTVNSTTLLGSGNVAVQATLVSGTNIKTVNSTTLLGSGDLPVQATLVSGTNIKTINSTSLLGSGDIAIATPKSKTCQTLTSSATVTMNTDNGLNAKITLAHSMTITLTNLVSGDSGSIIITQAAANYTVAISPTPSILSGIVIKNGAGSITVLNYTYDGTRLLMDYGATENLTIDSSGNVSVVGTIKSDSAGWTIGGTAGLNRLDHSGTEFQFLDSAGSYDAVFAGTVTVDDVVIR